MKTKIIKTLKTFDIDGATYYLDELVGNKFMISKDENHIRTFNNLTPAEIQFSNLAYKYNAQIETFNS